MDVRHLRFVRRRVPTKSNQHVPRDVRIAVNREYRSTIRDLSKGEHPRSSNRRLLNSGGGRGNERGEKKTVENREIHPSYLNPRNFRRLTDD